MPAPKKAAKDLSVISTLRKAINEATFEEREALARELGVGRAISSPSARLPRRQTTEDAAEMSRVSGGTSHSPDFQPAPPDWVVQHGGGMKGEEKEVQTMVNGEQRKITEYVPFSGERAYQENWCVDIYRHRWRNNMSPFPSTSPYDAERDTQGSFDTGMVAPGLTNAEAYDNTESYAATAEPTEA